VPGRSGEAGWLRGVREPRAPLMFGELTRVEHVFHVIGEPYFSGPFFRRFWKNPLPPPAGFSFSLLNRNSALFGTLLRVD
jgi:hypothetical protein